MSQPPRRPRVAGHQKKTEIKKRIEKGITVRCLGIGAEHKFQSIDPCRNRICDRCQERIKKINLSFRNVPIKAQPGD